MNRKITLDQPVMARRRPALALDGEPAMPGADLAHERGACPAIPSPSSAPV